MGDIEGLMWQASNAIRDAEMQLREIMAGCEHCTLAGGTCIEHGRLYHQMHQAEDNVRQSQFQAHGLSI